MHLRVVVAVAALAFGAVGCAGEGSLVVPTTSPTLVPDVTAPPTSPSSTAPPVAPAGGTISASGSSSPETAVEVLAAAAGISAPVFGPFRPAGAAAGSVAMQVSPGAPISTVQLRRLSDGLWWVVAVDATGVALYSPVAGEAVGSPMPVVAGVAPGATVRVGMRAVNGTPAGLVEVTADPAGHVDTELTYSGPSPSWVLWVWVLDAAGTAVQVAAVPVAAAG